jgi:hypothetical protein
MENIAERVETILADIEKPLADDLRNRFYLLNPLEVARLLHSLDLPDAAKAQLLALKVGQPPQYKGPDLAPLVERAAEQFWERIVETYRTLNEIA